MNTRDIVLTAMLLALCVIFQSMKGFSVYLTGSAVNAILIMATMAVGLAGGTVIAVLTPIIAYFMGATPILKMIPVMMLVIMLGNFILVVFAWMARKERGKLVPCLLAGAVTKAAALWLLVWYVVLPYFGAGVPEPMQIVVKASFSLTQLITALIGGALAYVLDRRLHTFYQA